MLHVDLPSRPEFMALSAKRADACVSVYLKTTPLTQKADASRIELGNLAREALNQLEADGFDKRRLALLSEHFDALDEDEAFWSMQANSLAVFATPDEIRTYRLANALAPMVQVSGRFHLKPLLRAMTFPQNAFVLALSENHVRLIEVFADMAPAPVRVDGLPDSAASAVGKSTLNDRSPSGRIQGLEGQNVRYRQYARRVDAALRPVLSGRETPLILAAPERLGVIYRAVNSYPRLLPDHLEASPDNVSDGELAGLARPVLDASHAREIEAFRAQYEERAGQGRTVTDISDAARAATFGAIDTLLVDIDVVIAGRVDDETGAVTFAETPGPDSYGVVDEIAARALATGARVLGVRKDDIPGGGALAAILRYAA